MPDTARRALIASLLPAALPAAVPALLAACAATPAAPDVQALLREADAACGASALQRVVFSGRGTGGTFGQAWQPGIAWPLLNYSTLARSLDFEHGAFRESFGRSRAEINGGGPLPLMGQGEQRAVGLARGESAWILAGNTAVPTPVALDGRLHDLWVNPHGAIRLAQRHGSSAGVREEGGQRHRTFSFTLPGHLSGTAWVDGNGLVTRIDSRMPHPVLGDTEVVTRFSDYRAFGPIRFPMRIVQTQGAFPVLDLVVQDVQPNAVVDITVPENIAKATERVTADLVAPGVWFLAGGSHNSVAIEMSDHIVLVESPLDDGRASAVFAELRRRLPGKPVRTVINSHHHFDHAGGLRAAVAEGATLVTSAMAKPYFERVFANPNTIAPDLMARSGRTPQIIGVQGQLVLIDGERRIEVHEMQGSVHAQGFMMVYLPKEKLLVEADAYTPGPPNSPPPPVPNALQVNLLDNIERLGLQVERILPLHSRIATLAELHTQVGRKP